MFQITRLAASMTKVARSTVKQAAKNKIDTTYVSDTFKAVFETQKKNAPYSKNIFKRAYVWTKEFFNNYKTMKKCLKDKLAAYKKELGENFTKQQKKNVKDSFFADLQSRINKLKTELEALKVKPQNTGK